jgi:hypothetical protein
MVGLDRPDEWAPYLDKILSSDARQGVYSFLTFVVTPIGMLMLLRDMFKAVEGRWGSREIEITEVTLLDRDQQPSFVFHSGDPMSIRLKVLAHAPATDFAFGVSLFNADGVCCYGTNTFIEQMDPETLEGEVAVTFAANSELLP